MQKKMFLSLLVCLFVFTGTRLLAQCGTTNIALNKTVITSSNGSGTSGSGVTDGLVTSVSTIWMPSYGNSNWAEIDLGGSKEVCKVKVKWGRWNAASAFKIQMSNSSGAGATWTDIATVTSNNPTVGNESGDYYTWFVFNELNITGTGNTGRYIRILVETLSNPNWWVSEMEVNEKTTINSPPGCSLTAPTANLTIAAGTAYTLKATASDPDPGGSISEVGFYIGTTSTAINNLLTDPPQTQAPYEYTWTPTTPGTYYLQARAKDNIGASGSSGIIQVIVTAPNPGWGLFGTAATTVSNSSPVPAFIGTTDTFPFVVKTNSQERYRVTQEGKMLIGSTQLAFGAPANTLLTVNGYIMSKGLKITQLAVNWPDYVFEKNYQLMPLPSLEEFIKKNKHLPGVPSSKEVCLDGISVGENQAMLLRKIEELTIYLIEQDKKIQEQQALIEKLSAEVLKCLKK